MNASTLSQLVKEAAANRLENISPENGNREIQARQSATPLHHTKGIDQGLFCVMLQNNCSEELTD